MKAILMSIKPQHVANILNGIKTLEIRKKFPKDYVGWVYIYCTKDKNNLLHKNCANIWWVEDKDFQKKNKRLGIEQQPIYNGKVVARFWCDNVEEILLKQNGNYYTNTLSNNKLLTQSCLTQSEIFDYLDGNWKQKFCSYWYGGYAIHITKLEIFDKPKEISEFKHNIKVDCYNAYIDDEIKELRQFPLTRAPQSWCYVEV